MSNFILWTRCKKESKYSVNEKLNLLDIKNIFLKVVNIPYCSSPDLNAKFVTLSQGGKKFIFEITNFITKAINKTIENKDRIENNTVVIKL